MTLTLPKKSFEADQAYDLNLSRIVKFMIFSYHCLVLRSVFNCKKKYVLQLIKNSSINNEDIFGHMMIR